MVLGRPTTISTRLFADRFAEACTCLLLVALCKHVPGVCGHGRLMDPPSRSSMWRYHFNNPPNYDDNQLFCGGFFVQWTQNGGRCGLCGDPWQGPRENEPGGKYANGIIGRKYTVGQVIEVFVQLTAKHKGWFEFRLCQHDNPSTNITQRCLDEHVLVVDGTGLTRYMVPNNGQYAQDIKLKLHLPRGVRCSACVLQWKYNTGNSWGVDPTTGRGCLGCGAQEQFYGCADVAIGHNEVVTGTRPDGSSENVGVLYFNGDHPTTLAGSHKDDLSSSSRSMSPLHSISTTESASDMWYSTRHFPGSECYWFNGIAYMFGGVRNRSLTSAAAVSCQRGILESWFFLFMFALLFLNC